VRGRKRNEVEGKGRGENGRKAGRNEKVGEERREEMKGREGGWKGTAKIL